MARVPNDAEQLARRMRAKEHFIWYDSVAVFQGAREQSSSWYNSFRDLANSDAILFFRGNGRSVGLSYSNQPNDRLDFAITIFGASLDFEAPQTTGKYTEDIVDVDVMPQKWTRDLPRYTSFKIRIAGTDDLFITPGCKVPSGEGPISENLNGLGFTVHNPGVNGLQMHQNMIVFPEPLELPANQTLTVEARIDEPLKSYLATLAMCPGYDNLPQCPDVPPVAGVPRPTYRMPLVYKMRWTWHAAAHRQLRGARSAAGAVSR